MRLSRAQKEALLRECSARGLSQNATAAYLGIHRVNVCRAAALFGIKFAHGSKRGPDQRSDRMATMFRSGRTLKEIGDSYGLTRERVRQIITKHYGLRGESGGQRVKAAKTRDARFAKLVASERPSKKSGLPTGVTRRGEKFIAHRRIAGQRIRLGTFSTPDQAHAAYLAVAA